MALEDSSWKSVVAQYQSSRLWISTWQLCNSFLPFVLLWYLMVQSLEISYVLTLLLAFPTAGLLMRLFIIQHDCGHGSFFKSRRANDWVGVLCGFFTFTPYYYWRKGHAIHHANAGNLEHRGIGDIYTMTVNEYLEHSKWGRLKYRIYRNPVFLFVIAPILLFIILYRFPGSRNKALRRVESSIWWTNLGIAVLTSIVIWFVGWKAFLLVQLPVVAIASSAGAFLFYVQHQFEETYWSDPESWDYTLAALQGSSYYRLPKVLQWFTGNIGFHHIHHLSPRIPNYRLEQCHNENALFRDTVILTPRSSGKSVLLTLWDEDDKKLIGFRQLKDRQLRMAQAG
ncbi:fatty acid desaturase [Chloroflexi bacterium TSY]|nr:fatty acid desaturase [Chloroflexi bacterium TSY]